MRTAALPSFRKLYRRIDHSKPNFENGLKSGQYKLNIEYSNTFYLSSKMTKTNTYFPSQIILFSLLMAPRK